ncbi:hypothetical protein ACGFR8_21250 [Streptomyces brevispora]|uniref:hypothetical protein n=1 Tax=Streptomyces brevispora TaxID=887462 RepID=UPI00370FC52E
MGNPPPRGDTQADGIIERLALRIGRGVCAAAMLLDVERILFGGPTWHGLGDRLLATIEPMVARSLFVRAAHATTGASTTLGENVSAIGAEAESNMALDRGPLQPTSGSLQRRMSTWVWRGKDTLTAPLPSACTYSGLIHPVHPEGRLPCLRVVQLRNLATLKASAATKACALERARERAG